MCFRNERKFPGSVNLVNGYRELIPEPHETKPRIQVTEVSKTETENNRGKLREDEELYRGLLSDSHTVMLLINPEIAVRKSTKKASTR